MSSPERIKVSLAIICRDPPVMLAAGRRNFLRGTPQDLGAARDLGDAARDSLQVARLADDVAAGEVLGQVGVARVPPARRLGVQPDHAAASRGQLLEGPGLGVLMVA